jgi:hypothetical protein
MRPAAAPDGAHPAGEHGAQHLGVGAGVLPHLITDRAVENGRTQALFAGLGAATDGVGDPSRHSAGFDAELAANGDVRILEPTRHGVQASY